MSQVLEQSHNHCQNAIKHYERSNFTDFDFADTGICTVCAAPHMAEVVDNDLIDLYQQVFAPYEIFFDGKLISLAKMGLIFLPRLRSKNMSAIGQREQLIVPLKVIGERVAWILSHTREGKIYLNSTQIIPQKVVK